MNQKTRNAFKEIEAVLEGKKPLTDMTKRAEKTIAAYAKAHAKEVRARGKPISTTTLLRMVDVDRKADEKRK